MAKAFFNIQAQSIDSNPVSLDAWNHYKTNANAVESKIVSGTVPIDGVDRFWRVREYAGAGGSQQNTFRFNDTPAWSNNLSTLILARRTATAPDRGPGAAVAIAASVDNYAIAAVSTSTSRTIPYKTVSGTTTGLQAGTSGSIAGSCAPSTWVWYRMYVSRSGSTNTLYTKSWCDGTTEPEEWFYGPFEETELSGDHGGFWTRILANATEDQGIDVAWFSVGTDGDAAPLPGEIEEETGLAFIGDPPRVTSRTTDSYTIGGTLSESGDVFAVAILPEATDPTTPAQIIAGTDGTGAAARGTGQQLGVTNFSFNITGTNLSDNPTHDIFVVGRKQT
jgi:hypothetical protein